MRTIGWVMVGLVVRVGLSIYGMMHDKMGGDQFTDIDYGVYTDAGGYVLQGESPFLRHTYRYTPLVSYLMTGNLTIHPLWGKFIFILADILTALLILKCLSIYNPSLSAGQRTILVNLWLFNPLVMTVSARGNADCIIAALALATIYLLLTHRYLLAALFYGFTVHFKIYPIVWCLSFWLYLSPLRHPLFPSLKRVSFTILSLLTFLLLTALFYHLYQYKFLYEAYLYHSVRKDNRTNFSIYFYFIHLNFHNLPLSLSLAAFLPQLTLLLASLRLHKDLLFTLFLQLFFFVLFNKVCAAQYFIWYMSLLPIILANNRLFLNAKYKQLTLLMSFWFITELLWNYSNYLIENQGQPAFPVMFLMNILFFLANLTLAVSLIRNHNFKPIQ